MLFHFFALPSSLMHSLAEILLMRPKAWQAYGTKPEAKQWYAVLSLFSLWHIHRNTHTNTCRIHLSQQRWPAGPSDLSNSVLNKASLGKKKMMTSSAWDLRCVEIFLHQGRRARECNMQEKCLSVQCCQMANVRTHILHAVCVRELQIGRFIAIHPYFTSATGFFCFCFLQLTVSLHISGNWLHGVYLLDNSKNSIAELCLITAVSKLQLYNSLIKPFCLPQADVQHPFHLDTCHSLGCSKMSAWDMRKQVIHLSWMFI